MGTVHHLKQTQDDPLNYDYFKTIKGDVPFWDHPHAKGVKIIPPYYHPITTLYGVLSLVRRSGLSEEDITIIKVLGDAICCTEGQLKRYMSSKISSSQVTKRLKRFREIGVVERWKMSIIGKDDEVENSSPYTLGIGGYKLLKHYYNSTFFMDPDRWDKFGFKGFQRYVSGNEIRCRLFESGILKKWKWSPYINDMPYLKSPLAGATIKTSKGDLNFIIDRAQMAQDFIPYLKEKLHLWKRIIDSGEKLWLTGFKEHSNVVVISAATRSMAEYIHKELMLDIFPFNVWISVEEDMHKDGLGLSFYRPNKKELSRMKLEFIRT